jgi:hypothetical protein
MRHLKVVGPDLNLILDGLVGRVPEVVAHFLAMVQFVVANLVDLKSMLLKNNT